MIFFIAPSLLAFLRLYHNFKFFKQFFNNIKKILSRSHSINLTANNYKLGTVALAQ
jgi:hypothetical protein